MERSKICTKERRPDGLSPPIQKIICAKDNGYYSSIIFDSQNFGQSKGYFASLKIQVKCSIAVGNVELKHE